MTSVEWHGWVFGCAPDLTREAYSKIVAGAADKCKCGYCSNFAAVRDAVYPADFLELLQKLGVDHRKEADVFCYSEGNDESVQTYCGWFQFVGVVQDWPAPTSAPNPDDPMWNALKVTDDFHVTFLEVCLEPSHQLYGLIAECPVVTIDFQIRNVPCALED